MLDQETLQDYDSNGFVVAPIRLSDDVLAKVRTRYDQLVIRHPEFVDYCSALLAYDSWFLEVAKRSEILDLVESVLGPDFALWNMSFFAKPAKVGSRTPWHQDGEYWPIAPLATCTVWIAIDASTKANGCLRVIPGSHREQKLQDHSRNDAKGLALNLELDAAAYDEGRAHDIELEAGQMSLHDVYLYHGSEPNNTIHPRRGMTLRFMPTSSVYEHDNTPRATQDKKLHMSRRTLYQMRGKDVSGQNDFSPRD